MRGLLLVAAQQSAENAAQHVVERPSAGSPAGGSCALSGELLSDIGQHDRRQDRQQLLEQVAVAPAATGQRAGNLGGVVAAEDPRDRLLAFLLVDVVNV